MKLRLLSFGRDKSGLFEPAVQEYAGRLKRYAPFELVELKAGETPEKEAETLLSRLQPRELLVCLDERGKQLSSPELAAALGRYRDEGRDVAFAIGGDEGHGAAARERASLVWGLSRAVLPHRLARVVVVEQLYRAFTILKGEPYHK